MPSTFDANLAFSLGNGAAALVAANASAYMVTAHCLAAPVASWRLAGVPLYSMMSADRRGGSAVAVIQPSQVDLHAQSFKRFSLIRERLCVSDLYCNPGPMQFLGQLAHGQSPRRLLTDQSERMTQLREIEAICAEVQSATWPGCHPDVLKTALAGLRALRTKMGVLEQRDSAQTSSTFKAHSAHSQLTGEQLAKLSDN